MEGKQEIGKNGGKTFLRQTALTAASGTEKKKKSCVSYKTQCWKKKEYSTGTRRKKKRRVRNTVKTFQVLSGKGKQLKIRGGHRRASVARIRTGQKWRIVNGAKAEKVLEREPNEWKGDKDIRRMNHGEPASGGLKQGKKVQQNVQKGRGGKKNVGCGGMEARNKEDGLAWQINNKTRKKGGGEREKVKMESKRGVSKCEKNIIVV